MKHFVSLFREHPSTKLSDAGQKRRAEEVRAWALRQISEGRKLDPRLLVGESHRVNLDDQQAKVAGDEGLGLISKKMLWAGRIVSALPVLFLLVDGAMKLAKPEIVVKTTVGLGYAETVILPLGMVLLACTILYVIPQTAVVGAVLLTGYLGGAVATQVRAQQGLFGLLFPVVLGVLLWGGLVLREVRLRALLPLRS